MGYWYFEPNNLCQSKYYASIDNSQAIAILILSIHEYLFHCQHRTYEKTSISFVCSFCLNTRRTRFLFYVVQKVPHTEIGSINHIWIFLHSKTFLSCQIKSIKHDKNSWPKYNFSNLNVYDRIQQNSRTQ